MYKFLLYLFFFLATLTSCQSKNNKQKIKNIPKIILQEPASCNFRKPLDLPFYFAGCFAEPRPNHFHGGIDIKTNNKEGFPIYAIDSGYVFRIKISPYGYGKALYINHANGYTSVYGHLQKFSTKIDSIATAEQYTKQKSELEFYPTIQKIKVQKGEIIAYSGNTGGSTGPHLHFEIRETATEIALNPLAFYPNEYEDKTPPTLLGLKIYDLNYSFYDYKNEEKKLPKNNDTIIVTTSKFGFGLIGFDKQNEQAENKNGWFKWIMKIDTMPYFECIMNNIDFEKTRMCNAIVDYKEQNEHKKDVYLFFKLPNNTLNNYPKLLKNGYISLANNEIKKIELIVFDHNLNEKKITFFVKGKIQKVAYKKPMLPQNISDSSFQISFQKNTFYDNFDLKYNVVKENIKNIFSDKYEIGNQQFLPLDKAATIKMLLKNVNQNKKDKYYLVVKNNKENSLVSSVSNNWITSNTKELGVFYVKIDTLQPTIQILNTNQKIQIKIVDTQSGIKNYTGFLDGKWANFYYDAKNDLLELDLDKETKSGEHFLKIIVEDNAKNMAILEKKITN